MTPAPDPPAWRDPLLPAYLAVASTGLYLTSFGPSLPFVAADLGVSKATASLLLTALFLGSIGASAIIAWRFHGANQHRIAALGVTALAAAGLAMGASPWWPPALACAICLGVGDGLLVTASHVLVSERSHAVSRDMSRLNVWFAVGAIIGPIWTGFALEHWGSRELVYGAMACVAVPTIIWLLRDSSRPHSPVVRQAGTGGRGFDASVVLVGLALLLYVGAEAGLGAWVSSYTEESFGSGVMTGALVTSGYWAALGLGRIGSAVALQRGADPWKLLLGSIAWAGGASAILAFASGSFAIGAAAAFATGLGLGPIWPSCFGIAADGRRPRVAATLVTLGSIGGVVLPFSQGLVLKGSGPRVGIGLSAGLCLGMLLLVSAARVRSRRPAAVDLEAVA